MQKKSVLRIPQHAFYNRTKFLVLRAEATPPNYVVGSHDAGHGGSAGERMRMRQHLILFEIILPSYRKDSPSYA